MNLEKIEAEIMARAERTDALNDALNAEIRAHDELKYRIDMMVALIQGGARYTEDCGIVRIELPDGFIMDFSTPLVYKHAISDSETR